MKDKRSETLKINTNKDDSANYLGPTDQLKIKPFEDRIDEALVSVNGTGLFQKIAAVAINGGINAFNLIFYNMAYMEIVPHFKCTSSGSQEVYSCVEADFCNQN